MVIGKCRVEAVPFLILFVCFYLGQPAWGLGVLAVRCPAQDHRPLDVWVVGFTCKLFSMENSARFGHTDVQSMFMSAPNTLAPGL